MPAPNAQSVLSRPLSQRILEYKYRFAQAVIFGLPVLGLQWFGHLLGGSLQESARWIALLQALLAGWVTYIGATGMLVEGLMLAPARITGDLCIAIIAVTLYLFSIISIIGIIVFGHPLYQPLAFHVAVIVLALWCGTKWVILSRQQTEGN